MTDSNNDVVILKVGHANQALAEAETLQQTTQILDVACAAETYAKRHKLGKVAIQYAGGIKLEALRRLGELLKAMPKAKGGQPYQKRSTGSTSEPVATLASLGIDKKISMNAQRLAGLPQALFQQVKEGTISQTQACWEARHPNETTTTPVPWSPDLAKERLRLAISNEIEWSGSNRLVIELVGHLLDELKEADNQELRDAVSIARDELDLHDFEPGGYRLFENEQQAATHPGAPAVFGGVKSTCPQFYKDLTTKKKGITPLTRKQFEARSTDIYMGKPPTKRTARTHFAVLQAIKDLPRTSPLSRGAI